MGDGEKAGVGKGSKEGLLGRQECERIVRQKACCKV